MDTASAAPAAPSSGVHAKLASLAFGTNDSPVAAFSWTRANDPLQVELDASESRDPNGEDLEYRWNFGDGEIGAGEKVVHQYQERGTYLVSLMVEDESDAQATFAQQVSTERAVQIVEAGMIAASVFRVTIDMEHREGRQREIDLTVSLTSGTESSPLAMMQRELRNLPKGVNQIRVDFDLASEGIPKFVESVSAVTTVDAREVLADGSVTPFEHDSSAVVIPLPVIITHGIMGDLAPLEYGSFGPGIPDLAALLEEGGYSQAIQYPTLKQLIYPSLHPDGVEYLAGRYMKPAVEAMLERTYADRVDIVAHSMGGIVARVYLERLEGGPNVRKLVTLGTPHEGAAKAHSAFAGYGAHQPAETPGATLMELAARQFPEFGSLLDNRAFTEVLSEVGVMATVQLLPDYPYYTEIEADGSSTLGPGWPTDPGMDLQGGTNSLLGPNTLLKSLNAGGFAPGVEYYQIYRDNHDTRTGIVRAELGDATWDQYTIMTPGDGTVPLRSLVLADYPELSDQLWKCPVPGTKHKEMYLDVIVRNQVLAILQLPVDEEVSGCSR